MDQKVREFVEAQKLKPISKISVADFMKNFKVGISFQDLLKQHNHEVWEKCKCCGNEEDLRKTWICSGCGEILFKPSTNER